MRIETRLRLNAVVSLLLAVAIGLVLLLALYRLNRANESTAIAGEIVTSAF